jgi:carbonic anhydrase
MPYPVEKFSMSMVDYGLKQNEAFAKNINRDDLIKAPAPKLTIVTCMDPRLTIIEQALGLKPGDADVIRNAGSTIDEDSIRSLLISTRVLGSKEILVVQHTGCGLLTFKDDELESKLENLTGAYPITPEKFYSFTDVEKEVVKAIRRIKSHPWISKDVPVRGIVYDGSTGKVTEITVP